MTHRTLILLLAFAWPLSAADQAVKVVGISDGDTVRVLDEQKQEIKVRLAGIDAPETGQPFSTKSKEALSKCTSRSTPTRMRLTWDQSGAGVGMKV